jgi:hypothetical protein
MRHTDSVLLAQKPRFDSAQRSQHVLQIIELTINDKNSTLKTGDLVLRYFHPETVAETD